MQPARVEHERAELATLEAAWLSACQYVAAKEGDLVRLQSERIRLTPSALEQGWAAQMDADVAQNREWVTQGKEHALFKVREGRGRAPRRRSRRRSR